MEVVLSRLGRHAGMVSGCCFSAPPEDSRVTRQHCLGDVTDCSPVHAGFHLYKLRQTLLKTQVSLLTCPGTSRFIPRGSWGVSLAYVPMGWPAAGWSPGLPCGHLLKDRCSIWGSPEPRLSSLLQQNPPLSDSPGHLWECPALPPSSQFHLWLPCLLPRAVPQDPISCIREPSVT